MTPMITAGHSRCYAAWRDKITGYRYSNPGSTRASSAKVKNWACNFAKGEILVELDHDDELTGYALELL